MNENFTFLCTFIDENGSSQSVEMTGMLQFEVRYDDNTIFKLMHLLKEIPSKEQDVIGKLLEKLNTKCSDINFYFIDNGEQYLIYSFEKINFIQAFLNLGNFNDFGNVNSFDSTYKFIKNLEVR